MKVNAGQAPSTLIPEYIGSDFDKVIIVADNMETVTEVMDNLDHIKAIENNLGIINTVAADIEEIVAVGSNIADVKSIVTNMDHIKTVESNLENINTVADNIVDVVNVSANMDYVTDVAQGIEGLPVVSYIGDEPPTQPLHGAEWYCTLDGRSYVWYVFEGHGQWVEGSPQSQITAFETATTADFISVLSLINIRDKYAGKPVYVVTTSKYVYATGVAASAVWNNFDNTLAYTPV